MENVGVVLKKGLDRLRALNEQMLKEAQKRNMVMLHLKRDGVARYMTLELDD